MVDDGIPIVIVYSFHGSRAPQSQNRSKDGHIHNLSHDRKDELLRVGEALKEDEQRKIQELQRLALVEQTLRWQAGDTLTPRSRRTTEDQGEAAIDHPLLK